MSDLYLVTGGAGFIGSNLADHLLAAHPDARVRVLDKLTYAATEGSTRSVADSSQYVLEVADVADTKAMSDILARHQPDRVMHLAAETHVGTTAMTDAIIERI